MSWFNNCIHAKQSHEGDYQFDMSAQVFPIFAAHTLTQRLTSLQAERHIIQTRANYNMTEVKHIQTKGNTVADDKKLPTV